MDRPVSDLSFDETLNHFGVKGMHWGTRRAPKAPPSHDFTKAAAASKVIKRSGTKALSNKELQDVVTRMNLEQQYSNLASKQPNRLKAGQQAAKSILTVGRTVNDVVSFVNSPAGKIIRSNIGKHISK